jgi:peptidoglycan/LPS O-acetylase OafA/YrhL
MGNAGLFAPHTFLYFLSQNFGYAPFLAYIFYACSTCPNMLTKWCGTRLMQTGGEISYSVYIFQFLVYSIVVTPQGVRALSLTTFATSLSKALLCILMTTFIAFCSYRIIELPSRRFLRKWLCKAHS